MPRRRLAVAFVVHGPAALEVDVLRQSLGDRQLGRIAPHVTVVPPINVSVDDLDVAMTTVERAASRAAPFDVRLGPVTTFGPTSPVRFLAVDPWEPIVAVKDACWRGVFARDERRPYHPHVTVDIDGGPTDGTDDPAIDVLAGFTTTTTFDRLTLLEHVTDDDGRRWEPYVSYRLG